MTNSLLTLLYITAHFFVWVRHVSFVTLYLYSREGQCVCACLCVPTCSCSAWFFSFSWLSRAVSPSPAWILAHKSSLSASSWLTMSLLFCSRASRFWIFWSLSPIWRSTCSRSFCSMRASRHSRKVTLGFGEEMYLFHVGFCVVCEVCKTTPTGYTAPVFFLFVNRQNVMNMNEWNMYYNLIELRHTIITVLYSLSWLLLEVFSWWTVPAPHGVCRWCSAAAPAAPGAAAWLSPAGAAHLCSYRHSPSTKEAKHSSTFIYFPLLISFLSFLNHTSHFVHLTVSVL